MIVIGTNDQGYICQVGHTELEKLTDKYYGNLPKLKVGDAMDLGAGYSFRNDIQSACDGMTKAMTSFNAARLTMTKFAVMVATLPDDEQEKQVSDEAWVVRSTSGNDFFYRDEKQALTTFHALMGSTISRFVQQEKAK